MDRIYLVSASLSLSLSVASRTGSPGTSGVDETCDILGGWINLPGFGLNATLLMLKLTAFCLAVSALESDPQTGLRSLTNLIDPHRPSCAGWGLADDLVCTLPASVLRPPLSPFRVTRPVTLSPRLPRSSNSRSGPEKHPWSVSPLRRK